MIDFVSDAFSLLRGFPANTFAGTHVALINGEYRWPIARPQRGVGTWPLFLHSLHGAAFVDLGHAWIKPEFESRLRQHRESFLQRYDWDWFVARKSMATATLGTVRPPKEEAECRARLTLAGEERQLTAGYSLRWVDVPGKSAEPVLYLHGRRITRPWSIELTFTSPADPCGGNANTE